ncbi:Asp23/Gls24 family envelope stress response protein [Streptomyces sp. NPDC101490]|uniref:Asp23/Gls24 family envelope stress response protein n=1 Tax=Streptomyces sp. NPDC101490 TaxID=3366143 RepID=UPI0037F56139
MTTHTTPPDHEDGFDGADERLPCGRLLAEVWALAERREPVPHASDPYASDPYASEPHAPDSHVSGPGVSVAHLPGSREPDPHPSGCDACRRAVDDLERLGSAVRRLRDEPDLPVGDTASLTSRIMEVVRLELRPGRPLPLGRAAEDLWIMEAVAARALRAAAETVPGVRAGSCRFHSTAAGAVPTVRIEVHAPADRHLPTVAETIRLAVRGAADRALGMPVGAVDIVISDIAAPGTA